jgi:hypothetical protein
MNDIAQLYSQSQQGGELPYFVGKQYGSGWLRTIGRFAIPILKRLGIVAANTAQDVLTKNADILPTLKKHTFDQVSDFIGNKRKSSSKMKKGINKRRKVFSSGIFSK